MSGVNIEATVKLAEAVGIPVIASGGLTNLDDIRALCAVEARGVSGAITGRAIYEGSIDFAEAQQLADSLSNTHGCGSIAARRSRSRRCWRISRSARQKRCAICGSTPPPG